jgi:hypothetical protein
MSFINFFNPKLSADNLSDTDDLKESYKQKRPFLSFNYFTNLEKGIEIGLYVIAGNSYEELKQKYDEIDFDCFGKDGYDFKDLTPCYVGRVVGFNRCGYIVVRDSNNISFPCKYVYNLGRNVRGLGNISLNRVEEIIERFGILKTLKVLIEYKDLTNEVFQLMPFSNTEKYLIVNLKEGVIYNERVFDSAEEFMRYLEDRTDILRWTVLTE